MSFDDINRRQYLAIAGSALSIGVAGCSGDSTQTAAGGDTPEDTTEADSNGGSDDATPANTETETETTTETATETEAQGQAEVAIGERSLETFETSYGSEEAYAVANLTNEGGVASGTIELTARFYNDSDNLIDSSTGYLRTLGAGETWHAFVQLLSMDAEPASIEVEAEFGSMPPKTPGDIEVTDSSLSGGDSDTVTSTATIANNTGSEVAYLEGISKFYESDGVVVGTQYKNISELPAGDTWEISNELMRGPEPEITAHEIVATTSL